MKYPSPYFQLVVLIGVRRCLSFIFTEEELKILDDVLPSFRRTQQLDIEDKQKRPIALAFALSDIVSLRLDIRQKATTILSPFNSFDSFFCDRVSKGGELELPMANGNVMKIPVDDINLPGRADDAGGA